MSEAANNSETRRRELSLTLQAVLICGGYWFTTIYFFYSPNILAFVGLANWRYEHVVGNLLTIGTGGTNSLIYLTLNRFVIGANVCLCCMILYFSTIKTSVRKLVCGDVQT
jgi:hypothetical protein